MTVFFQLRMGMAMAIIVTNFVTTASAQTFRMTTPIAPGVATPDRLETSIGTLNLTDGFPAPDTIEKIYDNLDRSRALQAYLLAIPIVNQAAMRESLRKFGPVNTTNVIWETLVDPRTVELTANDNTVYSFIWLDTKKGPLVVEIPPKVLGVINDFWYRWVADIGITGADKGAGGKYLILPPGPLSAPVLLMSATQRYQKSSNAPNTLGGTSTTRGPFLGRSALRPHLCRSCRRRIEPNETVNRVVVRR